MSTRGNRYDLGRTHQAPTAGPRLIQTSDAVNSMAVQTPLIVAHVGFLALAMGCATQAQNQYQAYQREIEISRTVIEACAEWLRSQPSAKLVSQRLIINHPDPEAVRKLAIDDHVTDAEVTAIIQFAEERQRCQRVAIENFGRVHPDFVSAIASAFTEADIDLAALINRELTVGEANARSLKRVNRLQAELVEVANRIETHLDRAHRYEVAQRQRAAAALQAWSYQQQVLLQNQQVLNSINRPRITNCTYNQSSLHCVQN